MMNFLALATPVIAFLVAIALVIVVFILGRKIWNKLRGNLKSEETL